ncbi:MADS-box transcription factor 33-like [Lolium rigidum]|uniref:MADS-box transcription factor 33-like n=1 Tax=Lolium rigidum TaxID=89674 RepID=UPI001F5C7896|nr:MADS-box transcription factor 33-like [Lolium rigidum]
MVRGKVRMRRIENLAHRRVTFCKRREGLLKKARELSVLCDAEVGVIIFSSQGKLHELATNGNMQSLVKRYQGDVVESQMQNRALQSKVAEPGICLVREEIDQLQQGLRSMYGGGAGDMTLHKLHTLEKSLELWICQMRSTKMLIMQQEIQFLENKVKEQNELMNMCSVFGGSPYSTHPVSNGNCFFSI